MKLLILGAIGLFMMLSGCAITGPADDGFENSLESIDIGKLQTNHAIDRIVKNAIGSKKNSEDIIRQ